MNSRCGILFDLRRYSIHDGPGIRTVVFFKGCPLRCWWCHNPESQSLEAELMVHPKRCILCSACLLVCPNGAIHRDDMRLFTDRTRCQGCGKCTELCYAEGRQMVGRHYNIDEVMAIVERDQSFYEQSGGGVTFSGGEPLLQADFLLALLQTTKARGLHTALDTCGFAPWSIIDKVRTWTDLFLFDLKIMDDTRHRQYTGVSNESILFNLKSLARQGHAIILRMPIIPGINDDNENLTATARFTNDLPGEHRLDLLPYHNSAETKYNGLGKTFRLKGVHTAPDERMQEICAFLESFGVAVKIGG